MKIMITFGIIKPRLSSGLSGVKQVDEVVTPEMW